MGKAGTVWQFLRALFPSTWRPLSPDALTHANTQNLSHFRACPASIQEQCPPKCLFVMANAKLPNRPGFALLPYGVSQERGGEEGVCTELGGGD